MMSIRSNISSLSAQGNLMKSQASLDGSLAKLSSGYRITKASDDAAGLGVSANLTAQYKSYQQAARNANDGLSVVQTTEAALNEVNNILTRLRELTMQASSDGITNDERAYVQEEADQLVEELDRINDVTEFNGTTIFGAGAELVFQVGIREDTTNDVVKIDTTTMKVDAASLKVDALDLDNGAATAQAFLDDIDTAIKDVSSFRSELGAKANRLQSALNTIAQASEAVAASNARIRDVDIAAETAELSRNQILVQAGVSVLAQANQAPQVALKLLG